MIITGKVLWVFFSGKEITMENEFYLVQKKSSAEEPVKTARDAKKTADKKRRITFAVRNSDDLFCSVN